LQIPTAWRHKILYEASSFRRPWKYILQFSFVFCCSQLLFFISYYYSWLRSSDPSFICTTMYIPWFPVATTHKQAKQLWFKSPHQTWRQATKIQTCCVELS
jgi:hypothetical protein